MYRRILQWPDLRLKHISEPVSNFGNSLQELVKDMHDTLNVVMGAGLAAPQIDVHQSVVAIKCSVFGWVNPDPYELNSDLWVLINPELKLMEKEKMWEEACLSVPGVVGNVRRKEKAILNYQDSQGAYHTLELDWPISGAVQHECDHLEGKLFLDRMGKKAAGKLKKKLRRQLKLNANTGRKKLRIKKEKELIDTRLTHGPGKRMRKKRKNRKK